MPAFGQTQFKDVGRMVRHLTQTEGDCLLNRNYLILRVWEELDGIEFSPIQRAKILKATPPETITRLLRKK